MDRVHGVVHGPRSMFCIRPDGSEAGVDLVLIQTSLLLSCKCT